MATEQSGGGTTVIKSGGGMGVLLGIAVLAVVVMVAVFLVIQSQRSSPGQQVADAATSVASSAAKAADNVNPAK